MFSLLWFPFFSLQFFNCHCSAPIPPHAKNGIQFFNHHALASIPGPPVNSIQKAFSILQAPFFSLHKIASKNEFHYLASNFSASIPWPPTISIHRPLNFNLQKTFSERVPQLSSIQFFRCHSSASILEPPTSSKNVLHFAGSKKWRSIFLASTLQLPVFLTSILWPPSILQPPKNTAFQSMKTLINHAALSLRNVRQNISFLLNFIKTRPFVLQLLRKGTKPEANKQQWKTAATRENCKQRRKFGKP